MHSVALRKLYHMVCLDQELLEVAKSANFPLSYILHSHYSVRVFCAGVLDAITPHGVMKLRSMFNDSVLDILYYMSHKYGPEVRGQHCIVYTVRQTTPTI